MYLMYLLFSNVDGSYPKHSNHGRKSIKKYDYFSAFCVLPALYTIIKTPFYYGRAGKTQKYWHNHIFIDFRQ